MWEKYFKVVATSIPEGCAPLPELMRRWISRRFLILVLTRSTQTSSMGYPGKGTDLHVAARVVIFPAKVSVQARGVSTLTTNASVFAVAVCRRLVIATVRRPAVLDRAMRAFQGPALKKILAQPDYCGMYRANKQNRKQRLGQPMGLSIHIQHCNISRSRTLPHGINCSSAQGGIRPIERPKIRSVLKQAWSANLTKSFRILPKYSSFLVL